MSEQKQNTKGRIIGRWIGRAINAVSFGYLSYIAWTEVHWVVGLLFVSNWISHKAIDYSVDGLQKNVLSLFGTVEKLTNMFTRVRF